MKKDFWGCILLVGLLILVSCGKERSSSSNSNPIDNEPIPVTSIANDWAATSAVVVIQKLNLSSLELNVEAESDLVFACDGTFGNSGLVNGVGEGRVLISGDETSGTLQFGHTKYVGSSDPECRNVSKETYEYEITGNTLVLCMVNYPYCSTYELIQ